MLTHLTPRRAEEGGLNHKAIITAQGGASGQRHKERIFP